MQTKKKNKKTGDFDTNEITRPQKDNTEYRSTRVKSSTKISILICFCCTSDETLLGIVATFCTFLFSCVNPNCTKRKIVLKWKVAQEAIEVLLFVLFWK